MLDYILSNQYLTRRKKLILDKVNQKIIESIEKISKENENNIICELNSFYAS